MAASETEVKFGVGRVTRFYIPLLVQGFSQSLSYPLVAGIVTHGSQGVNALTAFNQGLMILFVIGSLGAGLITTGLVFGRTWFGYQSFKRLNWLMAICLMALQCVPALPPFCDWIFRGIFNLPPDLAETARWILLAGTVTNFGFSLRNVPMAVLFNRLESGKANNATLLRIVVTLALAVAMPRWGLVGAGWGLAALTAGVWTETLVTWLYARPYVRELRAATGAIEVPSAPTNLAALTMEQFRFTLPLSLGGFLLSSSPLIIAAFVARTANAADMLAIHYVTIGVANPVAYAALKLQTVAVKFMPEYPGDRRLLGYSIVAGLALGLIALVFATPWIGDWYFGEFQNMPETLVKTAKLAIGIYAAIPVIHAVRARIEGIAAGKKHSTAIMAGQIAYTAGLLVTCACMLPTGCPGWILAITAIFVGPIVTGITVYITLNLQERHG